MCYEVEFNLYVIIDTIEFKTRTVGKVQDLQVKCAHQTSGLCRKNVNYK